MAFTCIPSIEFTCTTKFHSKRRATVIDNICNSYVRTVIDNIFSLYKKSRKSAGNLQKLAGLYIGINFRKR